jgi:hypothetical protein
MIVRFPFLMVLIVSFYFSSVQICPCLGQRLSLFAKNEEESSTKEGLKEVPPSSAIEGYEKREARQIETEHRQTVVDC